MNQIQAKLQKSKYCRYPHLTICIDGITLDQILHDYYPDMNLIGLIPTLLDWLDDPKEHELVWKRALHPEKQIVPLLMCPDDLDFWCTIVVGEIEKTDTTVYWHRLGVDISKSKDLPDSIGTAVEWLPEIPSMSFTREEYENFLSVFQSEIGKD